MQRYQEPGNVRAAGAKWPGRVGVRQLRDHAKLTIFIYLFVCLFFFCWDWVSVCSSSCSETHYRDQAGLPNVETKDFVFVLLCLISVTFFKKPESPVQGGLELQSFLCLAPTCWNYTSPCLVDVLLRTACMLSKHFIHWDALPNPLMPFWV